MRTLARGAWLALAAVVASAGTAAAQTAPATPTREGPMTLSAAVNMALARNPTALVANAEIRRAEALSEEVRATWLPTLAGVGSYTRLDNDRVLGGNPPRVIVPADSISANLTLTVPIFHPQKWSNWSHAKDAIDVARATNADVRRQLALATARAYLAVVAQKRVIEVAMRARDTAKAHYDFAHQRLTGGVGNRIDDVRAEQELATDDAQVLTAEGGLVRAKEALSVLIGLETPPEITDDPGLAAPPSLASGLSDARALRTDVKAAEVRLSAAEHAVRDSWTDYSPYLVGLAQPFYQNPPSLTQPLTGWQAQLVLTLPLYDGGLRYGQKKERDALQDEAKFTLEGALRQATSDVRAAFAALKQADASLESARKAATLAKSALELATLAYQAGATTNLEVIDAERRARDAETAAVIGEDAARQARLDLLSASGRFP